MRVEVRVRCELTVQEAVALLEANMEEFIKLCANIEAGKQDKKDTISCPPPRPTRTKEDTTEDDDYWG